MTFCFILFLHFILTKNGYVCKVTSLGPSTHVVFEVPTKNWPKIINEYKQNHIDIFRSRSRTGDVMEVEGAINAEGENTLRKLHIDYMIMDSELHYRREDYDASIDATKPGIVNNLITFERVLLYREIEEYLKMLPLKSRFYRKVSVVGIGESYEKREIKLVKIEHPHAKHIVFLDAGIHAREWISIMTALYVIQALILSNKSDEIRLVNWYIIPCLNPDGFIESQEGYLMQRKNKNYKHCHRDCTSCGVDLNRNFPYKWKKFDEPCSEVYPGEYPFSEPESSALAHILSKHANNTILYMALHSYMFDFLYPWGYASVKVFDYQDLELAANFSASIMNKVNPVWKYGVRNAGSEAPGAGGADDYAKGILNIKYVYTLELQGGGFTGFHPFAKEVKPMVQQNFEGIKAISLYIESIYTSETRVRKQRSGGNYVFSENSIYLSLYLFVLYFLIV